ncbi:MAG: redoxin domain-containing protein [Saprospiraceae bacterium]|nr:redoxin domain-containing protein [Saprospiraceae bacterium]
MLRFSSALCFLFLFNFSIAQSGPSVGDKAPSLSITDWLANVPSEKSTEGRPIIVDFWATWCGPCIEAVPHFNELKAEFASNADLLFLSMSDEKPEKINRSLKRINFKSAVVTDAAGKTHEAFQINAIPVTYLIDKAGIIQWMGSPKLLTAAIIKQFLAGEPLPLASPTEMAEEEVAPALSAPASEQDFSTVLGLIKNKDVKYLFKVTVTEDPNAIGINALPKAYFKMGNSLGQHLADLWSVGEGRIDAPEGMLETLYNLSYVNRAGIGKEEAVTEIKEQFLRTLGLKMTTEERETRVYQLEVENLALLEKAEGEMAGVSDAGEQKVFTNQSISTVLTELEKSMGILFEDQTGLTESYDFLLNQSALSGLKSDLASYGLKLKETKQTMVFYKLSVIESN